MEVIRFDGYTAEEKLAIAKGYLWPRQRDRNGLREDEVEISDDMLRLIISEYTHEGGRPQPRARARDVLRKTATADRLQPGGARGAVAGPLLPASNRRPRPRRPAAREDGEAPSPEGDEPAGSDVNADGERHQAGRAQEGREEAQEPEGAKVTPVKIDVEAITRRAWPPEVLPGVRGKDGHARRGDRPGRDGRRRRRAVRRGHRHEGRRVRRNGLVLTGQLGDVMKESARNRPLPTFAGMPRSWASTSTRSRTGSSTYTCPPGRSLRTGRAPA